VSVSQSADWGRSWGPPSPFLPHGRHKQRIEFTRTRHQTFHKFECRPECKATHLVHATDAGIAGHVLLTNVSLRLDAAISLELWRRTTRTVTDNCAAAGEAGRGRPVCPPVSPPLQRAAIQCRTQAEAEAYAERSRWPRWAVSNLWDNPQPAPASAAAYAAIWRCVNGSRGSVELHLDGGDTVPGRLVSVTVAANLRSPQTCAARVSREGDAEREGRVEWGHVLVVAAWDQMCHTRGERELERDIPWEEEEEVCRTVITRCAPHFSMSN
jgi:hypothetical protein